ncbi:Pycsar system effector family protein [Alteromonas macleodii]|uniref:Pycsar effector protein domain-containing protein n=1 Tax=Alteromonas macleodii TaxID=28108 RepID=A0A6T9XYV7_ALTMA|nr:Pycsar system effector family protein [Alteromonas macleodii]CAB9493995.1 conserved membrane protein of unknown function [Alteromonas macleodii]
MDKERIIVLESTLKQMVEWLKFAEAKNGALVAVGCATIFGVLRLYSSYSVESGLVTLYVASFTIFVAAAIVISLTSFIPRIAPPFWIKMPNKEEGDNPLFFGHACKYSKRTYLELFNRYDELDGYKECQLELAFCDQIVNNSKISFIKYRVFSGAVLLFLAGVLTPLGALVLYWVRE